VEHTELTFGGAARYFDVSEATIRNWVKTGYLSSNQSRKICMESIHAFEKNHAGTEKLIQRANKSLKNRHDHESTTDDYLNLIRNSEVSCQKLGEVYQKSLSEAYRNKEGIYYTPESIVSSLLDGSVEEVSEKKFCDPCCGSGNFILRAIELGFRPENIVGFDVDPVAVELTKRRMFEKTGYKSKSIYHIDFLEAASELPVGFDYIFTNPPWGKKLSKMKKNLYASIYGAGKSNDSSSLFFFACLKTLNPNGKLGLLLPESFFNISTFEDARIVALNCEIERLVDYKKPFVGLLTRAQAIVLRLRRPNHERQTLCEVNGTRFVRKQNRFSDNPKSIINLFCTPSDTVVLDHIFGKPHLTLSGRAKWGLGIVTGNNKKIVRSFPGDGYIPVYKGADIDTKGLKEPTSFIPEDFSGFQQVAPIELFQAQEKLVYRFISSRLRFYTDANQRFFLNSANMMIPDTDFPLSCAQLADLLNGDLMNWLFIHIYNTHKILRGDLETLPIHADYFEKYHEFEEDTYLDHLGIRKESNGTYRVKT